MTSINILLSILQNDTAITIIIIMVISFFKILEPYQTIFRYTKYDRNGFIWKYVLKNTLDYYFIYPLFYFFNIGRPKKYQAE